MKARIVRGGKLVPEEASRVCLLFDPRSGRVVHAHGTTVLGSVKPVTPAELEARARRHAARLGKPTAELKALHISPAALRGLASLRVNDRGDGLVRWRQDPAPRGT